MDLPAPILANQPYTVLAPMQDVTDLAFMNAIGELGAPDWFVTEYFRVYETSRPEPHIKASITENTSGRPVFAQIIGESIPDIKRTIEELLKLPIAGIDLNMGCPAPKVYKKNVGGGLLRNLDKVDNILECMRANVPGLFTVKMRIGFDSTIPFEPVLDLLEKHNVDLLSLHGRTVKEMYRGEVHYDFIKRAVEGLDCPVIANGNLTSARKTKDVLDFTGAHGAMIGRSAIRNPWIFRQCRELFSGNEDYFRPTLKDVRQYVDRLWEITDAKGLPEINHVSKMKKFLNFIGQGVDSEGAFLREVRRTLSYSNMMRVCDKHLIENGKAETAFRDEPYEGVHARPNHEGELGKPGCHG
jgi:tRNA-dihydrouridine synthase